MDELELAFKEYTSIARKEIEKHIHLGKDNKKIMLLKNKYLELRNIVEKIENDIDFLTLLIKQYIINVVKDFHMLMMILNRLEH